MGIPVKTVVAGGLPVIDVTATKPALGVPVTEAVNGIAVTKVSLAVGGLPVTFVADGNYWPPAGGGTTYATWDAATVANVGLSGGDLVATNTSGVSSPHQGVRSTSGKTIGKYYFEITLTTRASGTAGTCTMGVAGTAIGYDTVVSLGTGGAILYFVGAVNANGASTGINFGARASGNIIGMAVDLDNRRMWFRVSAAGNWNNNVANNPATNTGGVTLPSGTTIAPVLTFGGAGNVINNIITANFGASAFAGVVPADFTSGWPV